MATARYHDAGGRVIKCAGCERCQPTRSRYRFTSRQHLDAMRDFALGREPRVQPVLVAPAVPERTVWRIIRLDPATVAAVTGSCPEAILIRRPAGKTYQRPAGSDPSWHRKWSKNGTTGVTTNTPSSRLGPERLSALASLMSEPQSADGGN